LNRGSTQPLLTQTDLKMQPTLLPPTAVLMHFSMMAKGLYYRIDASNNESRTLAALRDALLPKLISGEVRVGEVERFDGEALS
jgi:type I restriction enzyme, S subunit